MEQKNIKDKSAVELKKGLYFKCLDHENFKNFEKQTKRLFIRYLRNSQKKIKTDHSEISTPHTLYRILSTYISLKEREIERKGMG